MSNACVGIWAFVFCAAAWAQLGTATISGKVRDASGAVVAGAVVTAKNTGTGFDRSTVSNALGDFSLPGLTPGAYDIAVRVAGFKTWQSTGNALQVDQNAFFEVTMEIGQVTETVAVTGQAPLVESQTASLGAVVDTRAIQCA